MILLLRCYACDIEMKTDSTVNNDNNKGGMVEQNLLCIIV